MVGSDGDTVEGTEDTTMLLQIEEEKCAIRTMSFVTKSSPVHTVNDKTEGVGVYLTFYGYRDHDNCRKKQETPVHL